jgi:hypothetical protein
MTEVSTSYVEPSSSTIREFVCFIFVRYCIFNYLNNQIFIRPFVK